jgi:hypothetical protein
MKDDNHIYIKITKQTWNDLINKRRHGEDLEDVIRRIMIIGGEPVEFNTR